MLTYWLEHKLGKYGRGINGQRCWSYHELAISVFEPIVIPQNGGFLSHEGTPKSSIYIGWFSVILFIQLMGYPIYGNLWRMKPEEIGEHRGVSTCQMMIWGLRINGTLSLASHQKVECHEICGPTKLGVRCVSMIFQTFLFVHETVWKWLPCPGKR
jgi:hypothetical protein